MKFELDGTTLEIEINGYADKHDERKSEEFCRMSISIQSAHMSYYEDSKMLRSYELDLVYERIGKLIKGELEKNEHLFFSEPVLEFRLRPALEDDDIDIDMYWIINLRDDNGVVTANNLQLLMGRYEIEKLYKYLRGVMNEV